MSPETQPSSSSPRPDSANWGESLTHQSLGIVTGVAKPCWVRGTLDCVAGGLVLPGMQFGCREQTVTPSTGPRALAAETRARGGRPVWAGKVRL